MNKSTKKIIGRNVETAGRLSHHYEYNLTDHPSADGQALGNVRVTFKKDTNGNAEIIQEDHYYPFGMRMNGQHFTNTELLNKFLYNGKELQDQTGYYDYGFRQYEAQLGRWHVIDAMAEKYFSTSPYAYVMNNPVSNIDVMGLWSFPVYVNGVLDYYVYGDGGWDTGQSTSGPNDLPGEYASGSGGGGLRISNPGRLSSYTYNQYNGRNRLGTFFNGLGHWLGAMFSWEKKSGWNVYSKNTGSSNLMIILADDAEYTETIDKNDLNESGWDYVITDSFGSAERYISNNYSSSHTFSNVFIRTHGGAIYGGMIDAAPSDFQDVYIRQEDFIFPGTGTANYLEAQSLLSISSHFNSSTNVVFGTCIIGNDYDYMNFLQSALGNVNLYASVGGVHSLYSETQNGKLIRKINFIKTLTLHESYFVHFPSFKWYNIEINSNGGFSFYNN